MKNNSVIKVLLVDDDEEDFILTSDYLDEIPNKKFLIEWSPGYKNALEKIREQKHDVYIVDYLLGAYTGIDLLKEAARLNIESPFIVLTGQGDHAVDIMAMEWGAADYLVKGEMDANKLERSIRYASEKVRSLKAIKASEAKFRNIFERSRDMIYITDAEGNFIDFNDSASVIFGYAPEELKKLNAKKLYENEADRKLFEDAISHSKSINDYEVTLKTKTGEKRYCLLSATAQYDEDGKMYYQGIIHDATRRKKMEQDLATAEKLAMTGKVVRMLAHEVRNPLTNITLAIEQMKSDVLEAEEGTEIYFDIIKRNLERINHIISELLNSSRPAILKFGKFNVNELLDEALKLAEDRITLKQIKVVKNYSGDLCFIKADAENIIIAFLNIMVNAIEAMEPSKGVLTISTMKENDHCIVSIEDNGIGISKENIPKIFDPFFSGKPKGTGLGLSTTHSIILGHEGSIDVESEKGKGTKFKISLKFG